MSFKLTDFNERTQKAILSSLHSVSHAEQRECPETLAGGGEGKTQSPRPLHVRFTLRRKSLLDVDAKYASTKDLLDCLTNAGVIPGDKEGQITLEVEQQKCRKGQAEETVVEVFE